MAICVFQINCNIVAFLLLLSLSVSGTTNGSEQHCNPVLKVQRNTVFKAPVMTVLKINCTVNLTGCVRCPNILWCKIDGNDCKTVKTSGYIKTEWKKTTEHEWVAFLIFLNISMEDAGLYRCKESETSVSHTINVTVTGHGHIQHMMLLLKFIYDNSLKYISMPTILGDVNTIQNDDQQWLWPYVYICSGIAGLVFIILTLFYVVERQGRKSTRIDMADKNQYIKTQKSDLLLPPHLYLNSDLLTTVIYRV
ncbi:hypothetical protein ABG768_000693 [Culter alburnus]|uniref:Ig-like domain-containing protein n=1 Tax=Culter alburnus TaxID=194366 RepID=A0AAW2B6Q2_CULAL